MLVATSPVVACGSFGADGERYERLDRLRVLAIQASPADVAFGETTTLRANVYEPDDRAVTYEWSWCPSRADGAGDFECNISEDALQRAWRSIGLDGTAPRYELGTEAEVDFTHAMTPELVAALCQSFTSGGAVDEQAALACFMGLEPSVKLTVRTSKSEVTAIRKLSVLMGNVDAAQRNVNPASDFGVTLRDKANGQTLREGRPLQAGHRYVVSAEVEQAASQTFLPAASVEEPDPTERRETLIMSWFITLGELIATDEEGFTGGDARTTFVDGTNELEAVGQNGWQIPLNAGNHAELHLVLRDERGGVGWTRRVFDVTGGEQ